VAEAADAGEGVHDAFQSVSAGRRPGNSPIIAHNCLHRPIRLLR
jgi:hypothetical protein